MKPRTTLALVAVLILLLGGYWVIGALEDRAHTADIQARRVVGFDADAVRAITVDAATAAPVTGVRDSAGRWSITEPDQGLLANGYLWGRMAATVADMLSQRLIEENPGNLFQYGLDEPVVTVTVKTEGGEEVRLAFGRNEPTQRYCYVQQDGGRVFLTDSRNRFEMNRALSDLRNRDLVDTDEGEVTAMAFSYFVQPEQLARMSDPTLQAGDESVVVVAERAEAGTWRLTQPYEGPADRVVLDALANHLKFAKGRDFVNAPGDLAPYKLDPPIARLTVTVNEREQALYIGRSTDSGEGVYARRGDSPALFVADKELVDLMPNAPDALRERRLATRTAADWTSLRIRKDGLTFTVEKDDGKWFITSPVEEEADQVSVRGYVEALRFFKADEILGAPMAGYGFDDPAVSITIGYADGSEPSVIRVGEHDTARGGFFVQQDTGLATLVRANRIVALDRGLFFFRDRVRFAFDPDEAARIAMKLDGHTFVFEKSDGIWSIADPAGMTLARQSDVRALAQALQRVRAVAGEMHVAPDDLAPYGLEEPVLAVTVTVHDEDAREGRTVGPLLVGSPAPDESSQRYAVVQGQGDLFRISQSVMDDVRAAMEGVTSGG